MNGSRFLRSALVLLVLLEIQLHLVDGTRGAFELYAAYERRIDGYPLARTRSRWFELGFTIHTPAPRSRT